MWFSGFVILPIWRVFLGLKFALGGFELRDSLYKSQTSIEVSFFNWIMGLKLFYRTYCKEAVKIQSYIYIYRTVAIKTYAGMYLNLGFLYKPESPNISFSYMYQSNWKNIFDKLFHFRWSHF